MINVDQITIKSDLSEVNILSVHFRSFCERNHIDEHTSGLLELAIVEAINNIIIHAYSSNPGFDINAEYEISNSIITIKLTDIGIKFVESKQENKKLNSDIKDLPEGNWGIDLINSIADEVIHYRKNNSNILTLKKKIPT